jgi:hypothetical protein
MNYRTSEPRGRKISAVANEILDKSLPSWNLERTD